MSSGSSVLTHGQLHEVVFGFITTSTILRLREVCRDVDSTVRLYAEAAVKNALEFEDVLVEVGEPLMISSDAPKAHVNLLRLVSAPSSASPVTFFYSMKRIGPDCFAGHCKRRQVAIARLLEIIAEYLRCEATSSLTELRSINLSISNCSICNSSLNAVIRAAPNLRSIELRDNQFAKDEIDSTIKAIAESCPNIERFVADGSEQLVVGHNMVHLAASCRQLQHLSLYFVAWDGSMQEILREIARYSPELRYLKPSSKSSESTMLPTEKMGAETLVAISRQCPKQLFATFNGDEEIIAVAEKVPACRCMVVNDADDAGIQFLTGKFKEL